MLGRKSRSTIYERATRSPSRASLDGDRFRLRRDETPSQPQIAVTVFPGSNDDRDAAWALRVLGGRPVFVDHAEAELPPVAAVVVPGGFSYGDYLRCGALARLAPVMGAVVRFAGEGGLVLGICNGFQILCEAGLLPGVLCANAGLRFVCRDVEVRVERDATPFTTRCLADQRLRLPVKHGEGRFFASQERLTELEAAGQVVLRYADGDNPNGSIGDVAALVNADANVMGLMPHPEHAVDPLLGSADGGYILASFVDSARDRALAAA
jgi:phosphoribosylformylglycinamidine synthase subunit PurQ / glutaminase